MKLLNFYQREREREGREREKRDWQKKKAATKKKREERTMRKRGCGHAHRRPESAFGRNRFFAIDSPRPVRFSSLSCGAIFLFVLSLYLRATDSNCLFRESAARGFGSIVGRKSLESLYRGCIRRHRHSTEINVSFPRIFFFFRPPWRISTDITYIGYFYLAKKE